jgi:CSLREA domain-containing protein
MKEKTMVARWFERAARKLRPLKKTALRIEPLEDRCLPSAALPLGLGAGLDGDALLSDPLFASAQGHKNAKALVAAVAAEGSGAASNAATPVVGQASVSGSATPLAARNVMPSAPPMIVPNTPATLTVNTLTDDTNHNDNTLSLREAILAVDAGSTAGLSAGEKAQISGTLGLGSTIQFASGLTGTIHLNAALPELVSPHAYNTTIKGGGVITIDNAAVFGGGPFVGPLVKATLSGLSWINSPSALENYGKLTLSGCTFADNSDLGAIHDYSGATLNVNGCTFSSNKSVGQGGAIFGTADNITISSSTFTGNTAANGGALYDTTGIVSIAGVFTANSASKGGALYLTKETTAIVSATFSNNSVTGAYGAAIYTNSCKNVVINQCTITGSHGFATGAVFDQGSTSVTVSNDHITGNYLKNAAVYGKNDGMNITHSVISGNFGALTAGLGWFASTSGYLFVSNSSITGNRSASSRAGVFLDSHNFNVNFINCYIGSNYAVGYAGGVDTKGAAAFFYCLIANNVAGSVGAGITNDCVGPYSVQLSSCTLSGNKAGLDGGGIYNTNAAGGSNLNLLNSTVSGNTATTGNGGGIFQNGAALFLINSTVADNLAAGKGGGIYATGAGGAASTQISDCTIAFNQATFGGGIYTNPGHSGAVGPIYNTIIAANTLVASTTASDIAGSLVGTAKNDLIGTGGAGGIGGATNQINVTNPLLGQLANNGGPTQTIMLLPLSPAINAGDKTLSLVQPTDQRGLTRVVGTKIDIGAVEVQTAGTPTRLVTQVASPLSAGLPTNLGLTVEDDSGTVITGFTGTVTFTSTDPLATLPTPYKFTSTDAGHHSFSFTLNTAGTQFVFLTDAAQKLSAVVETVTPPPGGAAFIDGNNQLWVFQSGTFTNTGGVAKAFSAGVDLAGNAEVWFLDNSNELWKWDNGTLTNTGGFALHIAAGKGFVAFSDGNNQLYTFSDGGGGFKSTGGFASRFTAGFDALGSNQIDFADGNNQLYTFNVATSTFTNTGGSANLFVAGQDAFGNNEIWFTDGNNQIWRLDNGNFTQTSGVALSITGSGNGTMYFSNGVNQIWQITDLGVVTNTGGFASHISGSPATTALFFSDGMNQLWEFYNGALTNTGGFAANFLTF